MRHYFFLFLLFTTVYSCSTNIPYAEEEDLKRPYVLTASSSAQGIVLQFSVTNQENSFAGYNLYISNTSIADSQITSGTLSAYIFDGSKPTIKLNTSDYDPSMQKEFTIEYLTYGKDSLVSGETYYIRMTSYSVNNIESLPSPEITITY